MDILAVLKEERRKLLQQTATVNAAINLYEGKPAVKTRRVKRKMSVAGRKAIAAAQRARWAKLKAAKK